MKQAFALTTEALIARHLFLHGSTTLSTSNVIEIPILDGSANLHANAGALSCSPKPGYRKSGAT